jgi:hypothetical protein
VKDSVTNLAIEKLYVAVKDIYKFLTVREKWKDVTYQNSFQDFGNGWGKVQYRKDSFGVVHVRGLCKRGSTITLPVTIFQFPEGYRPANTFMTWQIGANQGVRLDVNSVGAVQVAAAQDVNWFQYVSMEFTFEAA